MKNIAQRGPMVSKSKASSERNIAVPELDTDLKKLIKSNIYDLFAQLSRPHERAHLATYEAMLTEVASRWQQDTLREPAIRAATFFVQHADPQTLLTQTAALCQDDAALSATPLQRVIALSLLIIRSPIEPAITSQEHSSLSLSRALLAWLTLRLALPIPHLSLEVAQHIWLSAELSADTWPSRIQRLASEYESKTYAGRTPER